MIRVRLIVQYLVAGYAIGMSLFRLFSANSGFGHAYNAGGVASRKLYEVSLGILYVVPGRWLGNANLGGVIIVHYDAVHVSMHSLIFICPHVLSNVLRDTYYAYAIFR